MADDKSKNGDFYKILGLEKECTTSDLKNAYRKLAKKWHPDRCSASGNSKFVEESKIKFQAIQEAYSVLSDENKRFLYDVGVYDNDDDDNNHGMGDFLNEMVSMMSEHQPSENGESFEQLQEMFDEMFQSDGIDKVTSTSQGINTSSSSSYANSIEGSFIFNKRNSFEMSRTEGSSSLNASIQSFCAGMECMGDSRKTKGISERAQESGIDSSSKASGGCNNSRRRYGRKQKVASGHDVSSNDYSGIST